MKVFNSKGDSLGQYEIASGVDRRGDGSWDGYIKPMAVADINNDGTLEIIIIIASNYDRYPRGVCAFDLEEGRKLWEFPTGTYLNNAIVCDLDQDGNLEIILGSAAMSNGSVSNGTDDERSYLIVLDNEGNLIKQKEMGGIFSFCSINTMDFDGDEKLELITLLNSKNTSTGAPGELTVWDGVGLTKRWEIPGDFSFAVMKSADINNDGKEELIVIGGGEKPRIQIFENSSKPIAQKEIHFKSEYYLLLDDLNADGKMEIIVSGADRTIIYN
ncbi:MAG: hypothetical protein K8R68_11490, partial [Bacteroidales bacterium]|nr:hypothetical protein [Bacteroidales bacterium]